jgi:phosphoserine aminotransferase
LQGLIARSEGNLAAIAKWVDGNARVKFLAEDAATRSCTSICLSICADWFVALAPEAQAKAAKAVAGLLEKHGAGFDAASYRDAPPGLRLWGGATVETSDIEALLPWIDYAIDTVATES